MFDHAWLDSNLAFLNEKLTRPYLLERLAVAAVSLRGEPEEAMARRIAAEAQDRQDIIEIRIEDLLKSLATLDLEKDSWD